MEDQSKADLYENTFDDDPTSCFYSKELVDITPEEIDIYIKVGEDDVKKRNN